jgi:MYXO-CTERM domain-containing protein
MVGVVVEGGGNFQEVSMRGILWSDVVKRVSLGVLAAAVAMVATETALAAGVSTTPVPEIDGASLSAGLGLLGAGVLWLRARRRSK